MARTLHLGDEVEVTTDTFAPLGVPRGAIGVIVDDWADGSNDVEVRHPETGDVIARFRAAETEIRVYRGAVSVGEPRKHGLIFGRGDDLGAPPGDPPSPPGSQFGGLPIGGTTGPWFGAEHPPEDGQLTGEIPWELRDDPPAGAVIQ
jgi:hypothetical protein